MFVLNYLLSVNALKPYLYSYIINCFQQILITCYQYQELNAYISFPFN